MQAEDFNGLIAWLKSNPDKASFGTTGPGIGEIAGVLFQKLTGTRFGFVPYRGARLSRRTWLLNRSI
jgi:tripartite-type tricarboxylate transporter receptor subunit TctC